MTSAFQIKQKCDAFVAFSHCSILRYSLFCEIASPLVKGAKTSIFHYIANIHNECVIYKNNMPNVISQKWGLGKVKCITLPLPWRWRDCLWYKLSSIKNSPKQYRQRKNGNGESHGKMLIILNKSRIKIDKRLIQV